MIRGVSASSPWQSLDADVAAALRERMDPLVAGLAGRITAAVPEFAGIEDSKFQQDIHEAVRVALQRFVVLVGTDQPALTPAVREVYVGLGAAEAREERSPEALVATLRVSSRLMLREVVDALSHHGPVSTERVLELADAISAFIDELASASTDGFAEQVRELAGERDRQRHRLAELLLGGGSADSVVAAAAVAVGWAKVDRLVPVVLPTEMAREARFRFSADGLVVERVDDALALVLDGPRASRIQLATRLRGRGAVVGPTVTRAELPEAVRLTELTARLASPEGADAVFVDDHLATLALQGEPSALAALSRQRLAPFDVLPERQRTPLLETLESWLRHWGARAAVADELVIHPQTVSYRIRKARALVGSDLDDPTTRFELMLVLAGRRR